VAMDGTSSGAWDRYTRKQYPSFKGWNNVAEDLTNDFDPTNDLSPQQLQDVFAWHMRKSTKIEDPVYDFDTTIGGPLIPWVHTLLGNLRFLASFRQQQHPYLYPQERNAFKDRTLQLKIATDLQPDLKLTFSGLSGRQSGMSNSNNSLLMRQLFSPITLDLRTTLTSVYNASEPTPVGSVMPGGIPNYPWSLTTAEFGREGMFTPNRFALSDIKHNMLAALLSHTISPSTLYSIKGACVAQPKTIKESKIKYNKGNRSFLLHIDFIVVAFLQYLSAIQKH